MGWLVLAAVFLIFVVLVGHWLFKQRSVAEIQAAKERLNAFRKRR